MADTPQEQSGRPADGTTPDPFAAAMAVGAAGSADEARDYLRKQSTLADLQIEFARDLDRFELSHLRWRQFSDRMRGLLQVLIALVVAVILTGIGALVWTAAHDKSLVVEAFSVPSDVAQQGLTGQAIAAGLQDRLSVLQATTASVRPPESYANSWSGDIKVEIPDTGVSIGELYRYLVSRLGHQTRIGGEIWHSGNSLVLTVRAGSGDAVTVTGKQSDVPALLQKAAEAIYKRTQPYRYAVYLVKSDGRATAPGKPPGKTDADHRAQALAIYRRLAQDGATSRDRAWALLGIGNYQKHVRDMIAYNRKAVALMPRFSLARLHIASGENEREHEEAFLSAMRKVVQLGAGPSDIDMIAAARAMSLKLARYNIDSLMGDYQAAYAEANAASHMRVTGYPVVSEGARLGAIMILAADHDSAAARAAWNVASTGASEGMRNKYVESAPQFETFQNNWPAVLASRTAAEDAFRSGRYLNLNSRQLWPYVALAMAKTGDVAGAEALIAKTPMDCDVCVRMRGRIAAIRHDWKSAAHWYALVSKRTPSIPFADTEWGAMLLHQGKFDAAIAKFESAHRKGPHFADPLEYWGEALIARNRSDLALAKFEEADKDAPKWGRLHLKWGEALLWTGDRKAAQKQFAIAATLFLTPSEKSQLLAQRRNSG